MSNGGIGSDNNFFYINGTGISGVQNIDGSYSINVSPVNILGFGYTNQTLIDGPLQGSFRVNNKLVNRDLFLQYTGENALSGSFMRLRSIHSPEPMVHQLVGTGRARVGANPLGLDPDNPIYWDADSRR